MKKVSTEELLYKIWQLYPDVHERLFNGVMENWCETDYVLQTIEQLYHPASNKVYVEVKAWLDNENNKRKEYNRVRLYL